MNKKNINEVQDELIEDFSFFTQWSEKYEFILDLAKNLPALNEKYKTQAYLVKGCQSPSWLHIEEIENKVIINADSDSLIGKGIIALLIRILSGRTIEEIVQADLYIFEKIGLQEHLSMVRANSLQNMINQIKLETSALLAGKQ